jgi:Uncharacterized protein conserved in bacteria (DUF2334)
MRATYLVRFDDICAAMDWTAWDAVESVLRSRSVLPIVAVVPDNRDPALEFSEPRSDFWSRVRGWQASGWTIAVHGYQHVYSTSDAGIVGLNRRSEFAGEPRAIQAGRLDSALAIFAEQGVTPAAWVAPGHSFDWNTIDCIRDRGLTIISDGFFSRAVSDAGCTWVPQQLWRFRTMPPGLWTVCYHVNGWRTRQVERFAQDIDNYRPQISSLANVLAGPIRPRTRSDSLFAFSYRGLVRVRRQLRGPQ